MMGVGDAPDLVQTAANQAQRAARADRAVQAGPRRPPLRESLPDRWPCAPDLPRGGAGMAQRHRGSPAALHLAVQVVAEQLAAGRDRGWCPWWRGRRGRAGAQIKERAEGGHPGHPIGDGMVQLHEQASPPVRQARQEPHLPQRAGPVQPLPAQLFAGRQQLRLAVDVVREHVDVPGDVKGGVIDPQRPAQPPPRHVQPLPEPGKKIKPAVDLLPDRLEGETTACS